MADLTEKQRRFLEAYLSNGRNAAEAYRTAYASSANPATATKEGRRLLSHPLIAPLVEAAEARAETVTRQALDRYAISRETVLRELARVGFSSPKQLMTWGKSGVQLRESADLTEDEAAAVAEVSETMSDGGRTMRVKMHAKVPALVQLGKHLGLWDQQPADDDTLSGMADDGAPSRVDRGKA